MLHSYLPQQLQVMESVEVINLLDPPGSEVHHHVSTLDNGAINTNVEAPMMESLNSGLGAILNWKLSYSEPKSPTPKQEPGRGFIHVLVPVTPC